VSKDILNRFLALVIVRNSKGIECGLFVKFHCHTFAALVQ
jgi:hypothetical protein